MEPCGALTLTVSVVEPLAGTVYAGRDGDRGIARAEGSSIPNTRDRSAERTWCKLCRRDAERLISAGRIE